MTDKVTNEVTNEAANEAANEDASAEASASTVAVLDSPQTESKLHKIAELILKGKRPHEIREYCVKNFGWKESSAGPAITRAKELIRNDLHEARAHLEEIAYAQRQLLIRELWERDDLMGVFEVLKDVAKMFGLYKHGESSNLRPDAYETPEELARKITENANRLALDAANINRVNAMGLTATSGRIYPTEADAVKVLEDHERAERLKQEQREQLGLN